MYSQKISPKIEDMFSKLSEKSARIATESKSSQEAIERIVDSVCLEVSTRSKTILSDMLFEMEDILFETDFFNTPSRQNDFRDYDLRGEILGKYKFEASQDISFSEASRVTKSLAVGSGVLVVGGAAEVGAVLISGLSISALVPIPVGVLLAASLGAALVDYLAVEPKRSKKNFQLAVEAYLQSAKDQFINWFDEIEIYYQKRVTEIKETL